MQKHQPFKLEKTWRQNVVKGQCLNCERPYTLYRFPAEMTKGKERCMDSGSETRKSRQNEMDHKKQRQDLFITFCRWNFN